MAHTLKLHTGASMPIIGLGTWQSEKGKVGEAVKYALEIGYRHIDCAWIYMNEAEIGEYMAECFKNGTVKREDVFIVSKLWCKSFAKEDVLPACQDTLKNLQLDYLDLYLIHIPFRIAPGAEIKRNPPYEGFIGYSKELMKETWEAMETLVDKGLCKAIGVSNFSSKKIKNLLEHARIKPACNQVERHPHLPQRKLKKCCDENGIVMVAYSPLGSPHRPAIFIAQSDPVLLDDPVPNEIAKKHNCTTAQVLISWHVHSGVGVIPKSVTPSRILENYESLKVKLDEEDMAKLNAIGPCHRYFNSAWCKLETESDEEFWDSEYLN